MIKVFGSNKNNNTGSISFAQAMKMAEEITMLRQKQAKLLEENARLKEWLKQITGHDMPASLEKETEILPALFKLQ